MSNSLQHVGVLGMKWGRRKGSSSKTDSSSADHKVVSTLKKKKVHQLSNDELKSVATRLELERKFRDLNPNKITKGKKSVDSFLTDLGKYSAAITTITALAVVGQKIFVEVAKRVK